MEVRDTHEEGEEDTARQTNKVGTRDEGEMQRARGSGQKRRE